MAYHQGSVWPWLMGMYCSTYLDLFGRAGVSFIERMLNNIEQEMSRHCIGTISELFDGNPPFTGRGATSFLMNLSAVLTVMEKVKIVVSCQETGKPRRGDMIIEISS
jgi:hypothetical protein